MASSNPQTAPLPIGSILVLGAGELGMAVLRPLAPPAAAEGVAVSVLLRPEAIAAADGGKRADIEELRRLGCDLVPGDIAAASIEELADTFRRFDTVLSCIGFAAGRGTQLKLARAALHAKVRRYFPWQFGVDYDVLGRGSAQDLFATGPGMAWDMGTTYNQRRGIAVTSVEDWVREHLAEARP